VAVLGDSHAVGDDAYSAVSHSRLTFSLRRGRIRSQVIAEPVN